MGARGYPLRPRAPLLLSPRHLASPAVAPPSSLPGARGAAVGAPVLDPAGSGAGRRHRVPRATMGAGRRHHVPRAVMLDRAQIFAPPPLLPHSLPCRHRWKEQGRQATRTNSSKLVMAGLRCWGDGGGHCGSSWRRRHRLGDIVGALGVVLLRSSLPPLPLASGDRRGCSRSFSLPRFLSFYCCLLLSYEAPGQGSVALLQGPTAAPRRQRLLAIQSKCGSSSKAIVKNQSMSRRRLGIGRVSDFIRSFAMFPKKDEPRGFSFGWISSPCHLIAHRLMLCLQRSFCGWLALPCRPVLY